MKRKSNGLSVLLISTCCLAVSLSASAVSCYWIEYNGTYEGNFSEDARWQPQKPTASDNVYARSSNKSDSKIILDGDFTVNLFSVHGGSFKLGGNGSLTEKSGTYEHIHKGHTLEVTDNAYYKAASANKYISAGTLRVSGGGMIVEEYVPGPVTEISGGSFTNSSVTFSAGTVCLVSAGEIRTTGAMAFSSGSTLSVSGGRVSAASGVSFASGSVFALTNAVLDLGKVTFAEGAKIRLGENAELRLAFNSSVKTGDIEADASAKITLVVPEGTAAARSCPIHLSAGGNVESFGCTFDVDGPDGWSVKAIGPCLFLTGGVETEPAYAYEWTGAVDGYWSTPGNWHGGVPPTNVTAWVYIGGERRTVITNDVEGAYMKGLCVREGTAPVVIRGKPIAFTATNTGWNNEITLRSNSSFPVVFDAQTVFNTRYGYSMARGGSRIEHRGGIVQNSDAANRFVWHHGALVYGGSGTFRRLLAPYEGDSTTTFLSGADYTLTEQVEGPANHGDSGSLSYGGALTLQAGARLTVNGPWCQVTHGSSVIDGVLDFKGKLRGAQRFKGSGKVKTSGLYYTETVGTNLVEIGGSLTFEPAAWNTLPAEGTVFRIGVDEGSPRLAASSDWTYGPAEGAADPERALHVAAGATLTVDTENAETGEGHTVTFTDPLAVDGSLVKEGAGRLVLPAGELQIGGSLALKKGTLVLSAPVEVAGAFTADGGAALDFSGDILGDGKWRTVLTAETVEGLPAVPPAYSIKCVTDPETGRQSLRLMRAFTAIILR